MVICTRILTDNNVNVLIALTWILYPTQLLNSLIKRTISRLHIEKINSGHRFFILREENLESWINSEPFFHIVDLSFLSVTLFVLYSVWSEFWSELNSPLNSKFNRIYLNIVQTSHSSVSINIYHIEAKASVFPSSTKIDLNKVHWVRFLSTTFHKIWQSSVANMVSEQSEFVFCGHKIWKWKCKSERLVWM